jgi:hypothetical protein
MSRNDWEQGTLVLPSTAVTGLKRALRNKQNELHESAYQGARAWLRQHGAKYRRALAKAAKSPNTYRYVNLYQIDASADRLPENVYHTITAGQGRMPTRAQTHPPKATSKTDSFPFDEGGISFDGRNVHYHSGENNRQQERARQYPLSQVFFRELSRIKWTRGSGGVLIGNDEYNRDSDYVGGGANYITAHYGPRGCQEYKREHGFDCEHKRKTAARSSFPRSYGYGRYR